MKTVVLAAFLFIACTAETRPAGGTPADARDAMLQHQRSYKPGQAYPAKKPAPTEGGYSLGQPYKPAEARPNGTVPPGSAGEADSVRFQFKPGEAHPPQK